LGSNLNSQILMDYCGVGSIKDIMQTCKDTLNEQQATYVIQQTLKGLVYLHSQNILHLDVKSANILVNEEGAVKLGMLHSVVGTG
jgi:serine/threonine protein kinase